MKVLVTGATGQLGYLVCRYLVDAGHDVLGLDRRNRTDMPCRLEAVDLLDPKVVYGLAEGREAIVHLANHTSQRSLPLAHQILSENVTMNANVLRPGLELGVRRFVFASTIQVMLGGDERVGEERARLPYLPLDSKVPRNPKNNPYALSKELGERMLEVMANARDDIVCTALRFPFLVGERHQQWLETGASWPKHFFHTEEALTYLPVEDGARLVLHVLEREKPGSHLYFPAQSLSIEGRSLPAVIQEYYRDVPLKRPAGELASLVDISDISAKLGWTPAREPAVVALV
jgi:nucleoside-diphosphate-sugar epimerase